MFFFCHSRVRDTTLALRAQIHWLSFVLFLAASLFRSGASASKAFVGAEAAHTPQRTVTPSRPCPPPPLSSPSARPSASASRRCVLGPRPVPRARPEDRLYRLVARRVARLFARARTSDRRLLFPVTHETPTLQPKRSTACRAARQGDLRQGGGLQVPARVRRLQGGGRRRRGDGQGEVRAPRAPGGQGVQGLPAQVRPR